MSGKALDVLICHGGSEDLVNFFVEFFASLGLSAATASSLASEGFEQNEKVHYYLTGARLILIVATFDQEGAGTRSARPNVYLELAKSLELRPSDTLVLQEHLDDGTPVTLGSNLDGRGVRLAFTRSRLHAVLPKLLTECRRRELVRAVLREEGSFEAGEIINEFLDEMNQIWDHEFDPAWNAIFHLSYEHESDLTTALDKFFQNYLTVFTALVKEKKRGSELQRLALEMTSYSWALAASAWEAVALAKRESASKNAAKTGRDREVLRQAIRKVDIAKGEMDSKRKIELFREAVRALDSYMEGK